MKEFKRDLRIIYMGTPDFAVAGLKLLLVEGYKVVGVLTAPDKPAGRGQKLRESAVKTFALSEGLTVLQPTNLKDEHFLKELRNLKANLQVVVAFRMLPKVVWQMPTFGTFNLHASLLPDYRGAAPINWAIINGENVTGVTTFFIDEKIDTGEIILQEKVEIQPDETAGELHNKLMTLGAKTILATVKQIESTEVTTIKQCNDGQLKSANKIHKETCKIDWNQPLESVYNHIRGLSPYPAAWTILENGDKEISLKIYRANKITEPHNHHIGLLITSKKALKVAVKDGFLDVLEVQMAGKKRMGISDVLNGMVISKGAKMR